MRKGLFRGLEGGNPNPAQGPISRPLLMLFLLPGVHFPRALAGVLCKAEQGCLTSWVESRKASWSSLSRAVSSASGGPAVP